MEDKENMEVDIDTQPVDSQDSGVDTVNSQSQTQSQSELLYWGRLYPLKASLKALDLVENTYSLGRFEIATKQFPREVYIACSKHHLEIWRKQIEVMGALTTQIYITDRSSNGTFVNGHLLKKKAYVLKSNDVIGLPVYKKPGSCYEVYVFVDCLVSVSNTIPHAVRRKYDVSKRLGLGTFGEVSLVFHKELCKPYAMKTIVKNLYANERKVDANRKKLVNEINILKTVDHCNVIRLVDVVFSDKENFLILEFMEGKDLADRIRENEKLSEDLCKLYFYQIAQGVQYLHSRGIIHRDLKPANILLETTRMESILKLTDFGLSKVLSSETEMKTLCGTKMYVAPEVLIGGGVYQYSEKVDVWSMGVILYVCLSGTDPFSSSSASVSLDQQIKEADYSFPLHVWKTISSSAKNLINRMLTNDPEERITIPEVIEDHWLQDEQMLEKLSKLYDHRLSISQVNRIDSETSSSTLCEESESDNTLNELCSKDVRISQKSPTSSPARKKLKIR